MVKLEEKKSKGAAQAPVHIIGSVGRRKSAVARVWLRKGTGGFAVNQQRCADYFPTDETRTNAISSLVVCEALSKYDVVANVHGGGKCAQSDAVRLGIARALVEDNEALRSVLREHGFLTFDARNKERKKPGQKAARRKFQFVKR